MYKNIIAVLSICILLYGCGAMTKKQIGLNGDGFFPCPSSPNCVSSMTEDASNFIEPIRYSNASIHDAKSVIIELLNEAERCEIVEQKEYYIHAEFRSKVFNFVDDVEFYFPLTEKLIHVKSASRLGYYDFEKNKNRMKQITKDFSKK